MQCLPQRDPDEHPEPDSHYRISHTNRYTRRINGARIRRAGEQHRNAGRSDDDRRERR